MSDDLAAVVITASQVDELMAALAKLTPEKRAISTVTLYVSLDHVEAKH